MGYIMNIKDAIKIVIELAEQNVIDDPEMKEEKTRQLLAIEVVDQYVTDSAWG